MPLSLSLSSLPSLTLPLLSLSLSSLLLPLPLPLPLLLLSSSLSSFQTYCGTMAAGSLCYSWVQSARSFDCIVSPLFARKTLVSVYGFVVCIADGCAIPSLVCFDKLKFNLLTPPLTTLQLAYPARG